MNHFESLVEAASSSTLVGSVDLVRTEQAVHAMLDRYPDIRADQIANVLEGEDKVSLDDCVILGECLDSNDKHLVKFGALALLSAIAWQYDPQATSDGIAARNSAAAMSVLTEFAYHNENRVGLAAGKIADSISKKKREQDRSVDDVWMTLLTHDNLHVNSSDARKPAAEQTTKDEMITIEDNELKERVANFPWIDTDAEDIEFNARLVRGVNDNDVLLVDLSPYSKAMQPILIDARAYISERLLRSMEMQQVTKIMCGDHSGRLQVFSYREPSLPDTYYAKNIASNHNLRRLYIARIGEHDGKPVFARLGYSRTKQNQSTLSQLLGYDAVQV